MHVNRNDIPAKIDVPGAVARQATGFGDTDRRGHPRRRVLHPRGGHRHRARCCRASRTTPARRRTGATCVTGSVVVTYTDGTDEQCSAHDLFHWPPGHSVRVLEDAEVVLFSPQAEHGQVMDHMLARMAGA